MQTALAEAVGWPELGLLPERSGAGPGPSGQMENAAGPAPVRARILIVEDDWLIGAQIEQTLVTAGFEIVGLTAEGADAVALAGRLRPDLILMDIRLRGPMDGIQTAREIADRFGILSLFVSAHTDPGTITRTLAARPLGWVPKPFTEAELLRAVRSALRP